MMTKKISAPDLNIDLKSKKEIELFKWFLVCLLFGKPIQQTIAAAALVTLPNPVYGVWECH